MLKTVVIDCSLPLPMMYLPSGLTSTPCGLFEQGMRKTKPGVSLGSITLTPPSILVLPSLTAFSASLQLTAAM